KTAALRGSERGMAGARRALQGTRSAPSRAGLAPMARPGSIAVCGGCARPARGAALVGGGGDRGLPLRPAACARAARSVPAAGPAARPLALRRPADRNLAPRFLELREAARPLAAHGRAP